MSTIESMRRRISTAEDLNSVVRVMKALSAANVRQYEAAVESLARYAGTIEAGLQVVLRDHPGAIAATEAESPRWGVVVFGSDQGMCGSFNERMAGHALERLATLPGGPGAATVLTVGARVVGRLQDGGCRVRATFRTPSAVAGITQAVNAVLLEVEELRFREGIDRFLMVHHLPDGGPADTQLLPLDRAWLEGLASRPWDSRTLPMFTMDWRALFSSLVRQHLFVSLYRAFAGSLASENASRLASMQAAERNIEEHLAKLGLDYHQGRQQAIQAELLDIVAGFESLEGDERRRSGAGPD
jgi:F-type H+-transporting ATPase subunit gamma